MGLADLLRNYAENWVTHEADRMLALDAADELDRLQRENAELERKALLVREAFCD